MVLDFAELPNAKGGSPAADAFEQFAAALLRLIGYKHVGGPTRGPDGGSDLIVEETRKGISKDTKVRWLVSCKHFAHSGRAVGVKDEPDISDRVSQHGCSGFLGVYSTVPTAALEERLKQQSFEYQILTPEQIEKYLLDSAEGLKLAERFFPQSLKNWSRENPEPVDLFDGAIDVCCEACGHNLLDGGKPGIYVVISEWSENPPGRHIKNVYFVCKGDCDRQMTRRMRGPGEVDSWDDIDDVKIPVVYLRKMFAVMNALRVRDTWDEAEKWLHNFGR